MQTEVYYFSGTGNSLAVARDIAEKTQGTLISIPVVADQPGTKTGADTIGIVFPAYMAHLYGIPLIVEKFVKRLDYAGSPYIFAVCTCGGYESVNALPALKNLAQLIRSAGGNLTAEFSVRLPMNNLDYDHIPVPINRDQDTMIRKSKQTIKAICERVIRRKKNPYRIVKALFNWLMTPMYLAMKSLYITDLKKKAREPMDTTLKYYELMPLTDKSIAVDDKCNGCGTCARVCPVQNIKIVDHKPDWQHHCEMCLACDEWCPSKAIHHWCKTEGKDYHHPEVKVSNMLRQD